MLSKIGPFEILDLVGRGGMGSVYHGLDPIIGRPVAVKVIRLVGYNDAEEAAWLKERLFKEARAAGSLSHPGIVTIYQVGAEGDLAYIAMEYVEGPTLQARLSAGPPLDCATFCRVLWETAEALDYAHQRGIVHRDVKPANIMLAAGGRTKVTDFGIAKTMLGHTTTRTGMILGTPFYMSPEQVQGQALDGRSDQFSLAVVAYEMLAGKRPFQADQVTSICYQIVHLEPPSAAEFRPGLPEAVVRALKRGLAKDPAERFPSCAAFAAAVIEGYRQSATEPKPEIRMPPPPAAPRPRAMPMRPLLWMALVTVSLALFAIVAARLTRPTRPPPRAPLQAMPVAPLPARHAELPAPAAAVDPPVAAAPAIPQKADPPQALSGALFWTGDAARGTLLAIENGQASAGKVRGHLPGDAVEIEAFPAARTPGGWIVFTSDEKYAAPVHRPTPAGDTVFSWDPRHATDLSVWEQPGPGNHWEKLVLRVNASRLTGCLVEWKALR